MTDIFLQVWTFLYVIMQSIGTVVATQSTAAMGIEAVLFVLFVIIALKNTRRG